MEEKPKTKICSKCKVEKDLQDFYKSALGKYGRREDCKKCASEHNKKYLKKRKVGMVCKQEKRTDRADQKHRCRLNAVRMERRGELVNPGICQLCGCTGHRIVKHHYSYDNPASIIWLCDTCHVRIHDKLLITIS